MLRRLLLALAFLSATPAFARPALWKLADADTTIWLFGTIHVLPEGHRWRDPALDRAVSGSETLLLEAVLDQNPAEVGRLLMTMGRDERLPKLVDRVPAAKRARLGALVKASGFQPDMLDGMKSWAAAFVLTGAALRDMGDEVSAGAGIEPQLTRQFRGAGKPVQGLETAAQQLGYFDALPDAAQRAFLVATLDDPAKTRTDFRDLVAAWTSGDAKAIERAFSDDPEFTPALRDLLIRRRDQAWADALAKRLQQPGTVFMAVGAGHLVGPDSVQHMLAARGLKAVRVQ
ncbi:TraB/GumN family protein [uncultured Sphingomonas sp.]|uniref:TraB/GumN family protein n=1 Tax=uncultured Sphingomonas sp. TaxID=158754 RepID=UPI0025CB96E8|nr:TraB/GumN family protein [uncultured Sphingomonas sp.]